MSLGLVKMWVSISVIVSTFLAVTFIYLGRYKSEGIKKTVFTILAYAFLLFSAILLAIVLMTGFIEI